MEDIITSPEFAKVVTGLASLAGAVYGGIKLWLRIKEKKREALIDGKNLIEQQLRALNLLHDLKDASKACRAVLVQCTNSGSIPIIGEQWHGTIIQEVNNLDVRDTRLKEVFVDQPLDEHAIKTVQKVCVDGSIWMSTDDLPDGVLKTLYRTYNITSEKTIFLSSEKGAIWILALNWINGTPTDEYSQEFDKALHELRAVVRVHKHLREKKRGI